MQLVNMWSNTEERFVKELFKIGKNIPFEPTDVLQSQLKIYVELKTDSQKSECFCWK